MMIQEQLPQELLPQNIIGSSCQVVIRFAGPAISYAGEVTNVTGYLHNRCGYAMLND